MLNKLSNIRREREIKYLNPYLNNSTVNLYRQNCNENSSSGTNLSFKQKIILNTIEDLQRTLEYQSVELNNFHSEIEYS